MDDLIKAVADEIEQEILVGCCTPNRREAEEIARLVIPIVLERAALVAYGAGYPISGLQIADTIRSLWNQEGGFDQMKDVPTAATDMLKHGM